MVRLSEKEQEILVLLLKDFSSRYNAHSICNKVAMSHAGAFKALRKLEKSKFVIGQRMGRAVFYQLNFEDDYIIKMLALFLMEEVKSKLRWLDEFRELYFESKIVLLFGSILKTPEKAKDIDILIVADEKYFSRINSIIAEKNKLLPKKIHLIEQRANDLKENIKKKNPALIDAIRNGIVLHGHEDLIRIIADATK